ncbi:DNA/RNA nuclease SfsA [Thermogladius sp. 4427co]|uniref:DNA/RNA nuclease SfsA n=1 Tax=Thermogladius sp. 4427co TaxID=3450718 RepID=UPI003F78D79B
MEIKIMGLDNVRECVFMRRLNRFVSLLECEEGIVEGYTNNTGRLLQFFQEGRRVFVTPASGRTPYRIIGVRDRGYGALIDTRLQEESLEFLIQNNLLHWANGCRGLKRYFRIGGSIIDFYGRCPSDTLIELKSAVAWTIDGYAGYPDAPTERGRGHLKVLSEALNRGFRSILVFASSLPFAAGVKPLCDIDPLFYAELVNAFKKGVELRSFGIFFDPADNYIKLYSSDLPVVLECGRLAL